MALGDTLIAVSGVAKHFGEGETRVDALRAVDLTVCAGEVIALLGPSGSGKTTLLNIIGCILAPSAGRVMLDEEPVFDGKWLRRDLRRLRLDKIGFIFQAHNLLPFLTAEENVAVVLDLGCADVPPGCQRVPGVLDLGQRRGVAEPGHVLVGESRLHGGRSPAPGVEGPGDPRDVLVRECPLGAIHHRPERAGVDEEHLPGPVDGAADPG